jgi:hypothetical protein
MASRSRAGGGNYVINVRTAVGFSRINSPAVSPPRPHPTWTLKPCENSTSAKSASGEKKSHEVTGNNHDKVAVYFSDRAMQ